MKILCDRQQLHEAFAIVGGIAPQKSPKPIIQNVLLRAEADTLTFFATDMEMSARITIDSVKVEEAGKVLLPARETLALLKELNDPTVTLNSKDDRCNLESGAGSYVLLGDDPDQYPSESGLDDTQLIEIKVASFLEMVRRTTFAAAKEETRYAINGILLDFSDQTLKLVATDGRRLAFTYEHLALEGEMAKTPDTRAVVPIRALQALSRALSDHSQETLRISFMANKIAFAVGDLVLVSQLLENRFPEYEQVIPKHADSTAEISKNLLESNLRKVAILSSGDVRMVQFNFSTQSLGLSAESSGVGRADLSMDINLTGPGGSVSFNPDFVLDALKVSELETIRVDMADTTMPVKLTLGEAYTYILMPISGS